MKRLPIFLSASERVPAIDEVISLDFRYGHLSFLGWPFLQGKSDHLDPRQLCGLSCDVNCRGFLRVAVVGMGAIRIACRDNPQLPRDTQGRSIAIDGIASSM